MVGTVNLCHVSQSKSILEGALSTKYHLTPTLVKSEWERDGDPGSGLSTYIRKASQPEYSIIL